MAEDDDKDDLYIPFEHKTYVSWEEEAGVAFTITPESLVVPNKGTLEVTIRKEGKDFKAQKYWINLESYLFEIVEPKPTVSKDSWTQIYGTIDWEKNREIKIRIKLRDKEKSNPNHSHDSCPANTPEGRLTVGTMGKGTRWYYMFRKSKVIYNTKSYYFDVEQSSMELKVKEETEDIKERRQKFEGNKPLMEKLYQERKENRKRILKEEKAGREKKEEEMGKDRDTEEGDGEPFIKDSLYESPENSVEDSKWEEPKPKEKSKVVIKVEPKPEAKPAPKAESQYQKQNFHQSLNPTTVKTSGVYKNQKTMDNKKKGINKKKKKNPCCSIL